MKSKNFGKLYLTIQECWIKMSATKTEERGSGMTYKPFVTLEACRVISHMTQGEFADAIGVSKNTVFNWENGLSEPSATQLRKIADLSGCPIEFIFVPEKSKKNGLL